ncbi:MAG: hypothetical protein CMN19_05155 [Roseovarius sp.]|nr:hypothetical protein [Roseovarius sp.]
MITNGNFNNGTTGWSGNDMEAHHNESAYLGNGSTNRVAEMDGYGNQVTVMQQVVDVPYATTTALTFDSALRTASNSNAGREGFRVDILDSNGNVIATQNVFPTANSLQPYSMPVTFPNAGSYTVRMTELGPNDSHGAIVDNISLMVCFVEGTAIDTPEGPVPVETLQIGDLVSTEKGPRAIRWIGQRQITPEDIASSPRLRPIKISAGALGQGLPRADLWISRQHRMLVHSPLCRRLFDSDNALVAAHHLTAVHGVDVDGTRQSFRYIHLLLDDHAILTAEGAPSESLLLGETAWDALTDQARAELRALCPDLEADRGAPKSAAVLPVWRQQKRLARRLAADLAEQSAQSALRIAAE